MPALLLALFSGLASIAGTLAGRVLVALGIQYVTYTGFDLVLSSIINGISNTSGAPALIAQYIGFFRIGEAISIITGAITAKWAINGLTNGSITRMMVK